MRERGERWEAKQREQELQRRIDTLGTENSRLRKERGDAIRDRYADQEEAMILQKTSPSNSKYFYGIKIFKITRLNSAQYLLIRIGPLKLW